MRSIPGPAFHRRVSLGTTHVVELRSVSCARTETGISSAVHSVSIDLTPGSITLFTGEPGCGKNLILRLLGLLELPDSGELFFQNRAVSQMENGERMKLRDTQCGYVFPTAFLLPGFSVMENIAMPLFKVFDMQPIAAQTRTEMLMDHVEVAPLSAAKIDKLSPGLRLRVGLARALGSLPPLILVEEPDRVVQGAELEAFRTLLHQSALEFGCAIAMSASRELPALADERRVECVAGKIVCDVLP